MNIEKVNSTGTMQISENKAENVEADKIKTAEAVDSVQLGKSVDKLNEKAVKENYNVRFAVYKDTNRIIVEVVDKSNNQVISTFPPKQILEMARMVDKEFKVLDKKI
jgi:flagellar protein FlaG